MKKVKFRFKTSKVGSETTEIVEFDDDTTEEEIEESFSQWLWDRSDAYWQYVEVSEGDSKE